MKTLLLGILLLFQAERPVEDMAPSYWIAVSPETTLMAGDVPQGKVAPGTLLRCSKKSGNWLFSVEYRGWVHSNDLVPLDKAVEFFSRVISQTPTAAAYQHRGIAHAALEHWDAALKDFHQAEELGDQSAELLINLGNVQRHLDQPAQAIESYTRALKVNPRATYALLHRGSLLGEMDHWEASLKDLQQAAELAPESSEIQNHLGVALRMLGRYEDAIKAYTRAIEIVPDDAVAYGNRGYASKSIGRYQDALADYEQAISIDKNSLEARNDLAWLLATCPEESLRDPGRAVELAKSVTETASEEDADYLDTLATAYASNGQFDRAVAVAEKAIEVLVEKSSGPAIAKRLALFREQKPFYESKPEASN